MASREQWPMPDSGAFSDTEIATFVRDGYVVLRGGFSPQVAATGREFIWSKLGLAADRPDAWGKRFVRARRDAIWSKLGLAPARTEQWGERFVRIKEAFHGPPFEDVLTTRVRAGLEQLMGPGRGALHEWFGWWTVLFPGKKGPGGWHVDGVFHHHIHSKEQGLVTLYLFSDIGPGDGGTALVPGSHHLVARLLAAAEPAGLSRDALAAALPRVEPNQSVELTGRAGDVAMLHPLLIHGFGANRGQSVRFACNPQYKLKQPLEFDRADGDYSPVERAVRAALAGG